MLESIIVTLFFIIMLFKAVNSKNNTDDGHKEVESIAVCESRLLCIFFNGIIIMGVIRLDRSIILCILGLIAAIILLIIARHSLPANSGLIIFRSFIYEITYGESK